MHDHHSTGDSNTILLPRPTAWPFVLALGATLLVTGMVTHYVVSILGVVLIVASSIGWFVQLFPHEAHEAIPLTPEEFEIATTRTVARRPSVHPPSEHPRLVVPEEIFQFSTGIRGGIAGGIAMIAPATLFSLIKYHSIWYAANLLAAGGFVSWAGASDAFLSQFHWQGLLAAIAIQGTISVLIGLLYAALLPMFPRYPIITAGAVVPLIFTGIVYFVSGIVSPILNARIDWLWFVLSQIAFGLVCGYVVNLTTKVRTEQFRELPFALRAGLHMAGAEWSQTIHKTPGNRPEPRRQPADEDKK